MFVGTLGPHREDVKRSRCAARWGAAEWDRKAAEAELTVARHGCEQGASR